ncbi:MAG: hypothetical protein RBT02_01485 [Bacteroidales bacterium]|jgi:hypothetical protein|nr:hypothetical protein [Bacteroidales bacterium]
MKRLFIVTIIALSVIQSCFGQSLMEKLVQFRTDMMPKYGTYFTSADLDDGDRLILKAGIPYSNLADDDKQSIMEVLLRSWQEPLVIVICETRRELWGWDSQVRSASLIDLWDLNPEPVAVETSTEPSAVARHPWFFYVGSAQQIDSDKNINAALSGRVGVFLLRNKWDMALTLSEAVAGNLESEDLSITTSAGVMSKIYFPIRKYNIGPNAGAEVAVTIPSGGKATFTPSFLVGLSWYVGIGSMDVGLRVGSNTMMMLGYTVIPNFKFKK